MYILNIIILNESLSSRNPVLGGIIIVIYIIDLADKFKLWSSCLSLRTIRKYSGRSAVQTTGSAFKESRYARWSGHTHVCWNSTRQLWNNKGGEVGEYSTSLRMQTDGGQTGVNIDKECSHDNMVYHQYDASLSSLLDKHAPSKRIYVAERLMNDWMTDDILVLKVLRHK